MALLNEEIRNHLIDKFSVLEHPVRLINFTQTLECQFCGETRSLLEEVASLSDKITLDVFNFQVDTEEVKRYSIDKIPATVVEGERDYGIRFYGIPSGYEFMSLIDAVERVSARDSDLDDETREKLAALEDPIYLQVFVTPT